MNTLPLTTGSLALSSSLHLQIMFPLWHFTSFPSHEHAHVAEAVGDGEGVGLGWLLPIRQLLALRLARSRDSSLVISEPRTVLSLT